MGKTRKTITFDIDTKAGDKLLGNYRKAYYQIQKFLQTENGFCHPEGSVYESPEAMSYMEIEQLVEDMLDKYPKLKNCIRDIRSTNIKRIHILNHLLEDKEPQLIQEDYASIENDKNNENHELLEPVPSHNNRLDNTRKNIVFDIDTHIGDELLGNYRKAHYQIQKFLQTENGFRHPEGSVYESPEVMAYMEIERLVEDMLDEYPHLRYCIRDIRTNSIGKTHVLNPLLNDSIEIQEQDNGIPENYFNSDIDEYCDLQDSQETSDERINNIETWDNYNAQVITSQDVSGVKMIALYDFDEEFEL